MSEVFTTTCPKCATVLATEGLVQGTAIVCAGCFTEFWLGTAGTAPPRLKPIEIEGALPSTAVTRALLPVGRSGWAIAAGYLALFSMLPVFGIGALATGVVALRDIRRNPHKRGRGRAIFGIVMGSIMSLIYLVLLVLGIVGSMT